MQTVPGMEVWDGCLPSCCRPTGAVQANMGELVGSCVPPAARERAVTKCASQIHPLQHPLLLQSWRSVARQVSGAPSIHQGSVSQTSISSVRPPAPDAPSRMRRMLMGKEIAAAE